MCGAHVAGEVGDPVGIAEQDAVVVTVTVTVVVMTIEGVEVMMDTVSLGETVISFIDMVISGQFWVLSGVNTTGVTMFPGDTSI